MATLTQTTTKCLVRLQFSSTAGTLGNRPHVVVYPSGFAERVWTVAEWIRQRLCCAVLCRAVIKLPLTCVVVCYLVNTNASGESMCFVFNTRSVEGVTMMMMVVRTTAVVFSLTLNIHNHKTHRIWFGLEDFPLSRRPGFVSVCRLRRWESLPVCSLWTLCPV